MLSYLSQSNIFTMWRVSCGQHVDISIRCCLMYRNYRYKSVASQTPHDSCNNYTLSFTNKLEIEKIFKLINIMLLVLSQCKQQIFNFKSVEQTRTIPFRSIIDLMSIWCVVIPKIFLYLNHCKSASTRSADDTMEVDPKHWLNEDRTTSFSLCDFQRIGLKLYNVF